MNLGVSKTQTYDLMRVSLRKIKCPSLIGLYKPSAHIYTAGPLKLENTCSTISTVVDDEDARVEEHVDGLLIEAREGDGVVEEKKEEEEGHCNSEVLKSCLKKVVLESADGGESEKKRKKKVQWVDLMGKELAEIREFESSVQDMRYDGFQNCVCVIL